LNIGTDQTAGVKRKNNVSDHQSRPSLEFHVEHVNLILSKDNNNFLLLQPKTTATMAMDSMMLAQLMKDMQVRSLFVWS
jgi:hypothetical protein